MIYSTNLALQHTEYDNPACTAKMLRQWCSPERILAVTDLADEDALLFHVIRQSRRTSAKVLLVHVLQPIRSSANRCLVIQAAQKTHTGESAQAALERMARQLHWVGIQCEPIILRGEPLEEILSLVTTRAVDRVLVTVQEDPVEQDPELKMLLQEILPRIEVPVCAVRRCVSPASEFDRSSVRIILALSLRSDCAIPLAFACRLAQEEHAHLTLLHVFDSTDRDVKAIDRTPNAIASRLPAMELREAKLLCPVEIAVSDGDPAAAILGLQRCLNQDFIILGHAGVDSREDSVVQRIVSKAHCPVIILGQSAAALTYKIGQRAVLPKPPHRF